jgi:hypothetical protein
MLYALALYYAREAAKDQIRARGEKISAYLPRDLTATAMELLMADPDRFFHQARDIIAKEIEAEQAKERGHTLSQSANSPPAKQPQTPRIA